MSSLDERLLASRARLLEEIDQPDLVQIADRAHRLRRRRVVGRTGAALLALVAIGALAARPWAGPTANPTPAATPTPAPAQSGVVYADAGITVNGLIPHQRITELAGDVIDVEFVDPDRGWVLAADCGIGSSICSLTVAATADGGLTWAASPVAPARVPDLVVLDAATVVLHGPDRSMVSTDGGTGWQVADTTSHPVATLDKNARPLLRTGASGGCVGAVVEVWAPGYGYRGDLASQPPLDPCWIAAAPAADGAWWVGGTAHGVPALAVTRDRGQSWQPYALPGATGDRAEVAMLGRDVYATAVSDSGSVRRLHGIFRSTDSAPFVRTWPAAGPPTTIGGQPVPLLDGRLLVSNTLGDVVDLGAWFVSEDGGGTFTAARRLPPVGKLTRTPSGYVAFDIVADGWTAYSSDGATWRKLHVH